MGEKIQFVRNYSDISTDQGFQFEFHCDRCGVGYRTEFKRSVTGTISGMLDTASWLFGGIFGQAANVSEQLRSAGWKKARDEALAEAMQQMKEDFIQCPHCSGWVCRKGCWNEKRGLCKDCAPDLGVEMSVAQSRRSVEEIHAHAAMAEEDKKLGTENCGRPLEPPVRSAVHPKPLMPNFVASAALMSRQKNAAVNVTPNYP